MNKKPTIRERSEIPEHSLILTSDGFVSVRDKERSQFVLLGRAHDSFTSQDASFELLKSGCADIEAVWLCTEEAKRSVAFRTVKARVHEALPSLVYTQPSILTAESEVILGIYEESASRAREPHANDTETSDFFGRLVKEALDIGASDIHISPREKSDSFIELRINGMLQRSKHPLRTFSFGMDLIRTIYTSLADPTSRSPASFDKSEYSSCRVQVTVDDKSVSLRYEHMETAQNGIDCVMRVIVENDSRMVRHQERNYFGFSESHNAEMERMFAKSNGLVIVCGIVGSGKSTTLRNELISILNKRDGICVRLLEDPVEYIIQGASHVPVKGGDFKRALRSCLRMDNNVIMIGEIRDPETAEMSVDAVLTGHQILTTLHTSSCLEAVPRLRKLGVDKDTLRLNNFISGIVYQKLVPVLCDHCKVPIKDAKGHPKVDMALIRRISHSVGEQALKASSDKICIRSTGGCPHCNHSGITGRTVCAEVLTPSVEMKELWGKGDQLGAHNLWREAWTPGWKDFRGKTAFEHALSKMLKGIVSPLDIEDQFHLLDDCIAYTDLVIFYNKSKTQSRAG